MTSKFMLSIKDGGLLFCHVFIMVKNLDYDTIEKTKLRLKGVFLSTMHGRMKKSTD